MAVGTFLATTYGWRPMLGDEATNLRDYLMSALMLNFPVDRKPLALATTWSLWAEVLFYVMVVLIIPIIRSRPLLATWILTAAELAVMLPYKVSADLSYLGYFSIYLPLFVIGRVFYLHHTGKLDGAKVAGLLAANALVFVLMYEFRFPGLLTEGPTEAVWTYVLAVLTFQIFMVLQLRSVSPLLSFFADISYALYLLHLPVGGLAMSFAYSFGLEQIWVFLFGVCASVTAAYLVTRFVEKPAQRVGRSVLNRLPKTSPVAATDP